MHASMNSKVTFNLTRHGRRWPQAEPPRSVSSHVLPIDLAPHSATKRYIPAQHAPRPEQGAAALKIVDIRQKGVGVGRNSACIALSWTMGEERSFLAASNAEQGSALSDEACRQGTRGDDGGSRPHLVRPEGAPKRAVWGRVGTEGLSGPI